MGASAATLWFIDVAEPKGILAIAGKPDEQASAAIAEQVLGGPVIARPESLARAANPQPGHVYVGAFGGLTVVTHHALRVDQPSALDEKWWNLVPAHRVFLLSTDADRAVGGFAVRTEGALRRSFSAHPVDILENTGIPELFEGPFWAGEHPLTYAPGVPPDPRALPFHPMELSEQANRELLGFRFTHPLAATDLDPARIQVLDFVLATQPPAAPLPDGASSGIAGAPSAMAGAPGHPVEQPPRPDGPTPQRAAPSNTGPQQPGPHPPDHQHAGPQQPGHQHTAPQAPGAQGLVPPAPQPDAHDERGRVRSFFGF